MTTAEKFEKKMGALTTAQIVELIRVTWNDPIGGFFREIGFSIIEDREGEEEADRIFAEIYAAA